MRGHRDFYVLVSESPLNVCDISNGCYAKHCYKNAVFVFFFLSWIGHVKGDSQFRKLTSLSTLATSIKDETHLMEQGGTGRHMLILLPGPQAETGNVYFLQWWSSGKRILWITRYPWALPNIPRQRKHSEATQILKKTATTQI